MTKKRKRMRHLATFSAFLLFFGWMLLTAFKSITPPPVPLPEPEPEKEKEEEPAEKVEKQNSQLQSVNLRYEAAVSETAIEEMENGRFIVETRLPEGTGRQRVFVMLLSRGGIIVVRDSQDAYQLLHSKQSREALETAEINHEAYAFHRPRRISQRDLDLMAITQTEPGDIPYLVMPKQFEAQILSEIERTLSGPITDYSQASLYLEISHGGHLSLTIEAVKDRQNQALAINQTIHGL